MAMPAHDRDPIVAVAGDGLARIGGDSGVGHETRRRVAQAVEGEGGDGASGAGLRFLALLRRSAVADDLADDSGLVHELLEFAGEAVCSADALAVELREDRRLADAARLLSEPCDEGGVQRDLQLVSRFFR